MHRRVRQHLMAIWLAMLGILFSAMAPALSHAMDAAGQGVEHVQVCTMAGMQTVAIDMAAPGSPAKDMADHLLEHCPCCATQGSPLALPPASAVLPEFPPQLQSRPPLFYRAPHTLFAWTAAPPRGPPFLA